MPTVFKDSQEDQQIYTEEAFSDKNDLSIYLSIYLSTYLCIYVTIYPSIYLLKYLEVGTPCLDFLAPLSIQCISL